MIQHLNPIEYPSILTWKKDLNSCYLEANQNCVDLFGFKKTEDIIGRTDYDLPCKLSNFSDIFREHDRIVIEKQRTLKILEIQPCVNETWKIFLVTKTPLYNMEKEIHGTSAISIDITSFFSKIPNLIEFFHGSGGKILENHPGVVNKNNRFNLTNRQSECLFFLMRGKSIKEIGKILGLSPKTVEHYLETVKSKFDCKNKSELIDQSYKLGFSNIIPESFLKTQTSIILE